MLVNFSREEVSIFPQLLKGFITPHTSQKNVQTVSSRDLRESLLPETGESAGVKCQVEVVKF